MKNMISQERKKFSQRKECKYIKNKMVDFQHKNIVKIGFLITNLKKM